MGYQASYVLASLQFSGTAMTVCSVYTVTIINRPKYLDKGRTLGAEADNFDKPK